MDSIKNPLDPSPNIGYFFIISKPYDQRANLSVTELSTPILIKRKEVSSNSFFGAIRSPRK